MAADKPVGSAHATIRLTIDGRPAAGPAGMTIWEAARQLGIAIPVLCHQPRLRPVAVCRMCVVDIGGRVLAASCVRACEEGMNVTTGGERIDRQRRMLTALLLAEHPLPCAKEKATADCELEALGRHYGLLQGTSLVLGPWSLAKTPLAKDKGQRTKDASS